MSKSDSAEPQLSVGAFEGRCKTLATRFGHSIGLANGAVTFAPEIISGTEALMMLTGRASEPVARNQGTHHDVIPLCTVGDNVLAWMGYREYWQKELNERNLRFIQAGFTLHLGRRGELAKPQILRSEWVGRRSGHFWNQAGHPHWQLDVLDTARTRRPEPPARFDDPAAPSAPVDFAAVPEPELGEDVLFGLTIERMHFASAALWWKQPEVPVAHPPESVSDINRWILGCAAYLRQEVRRCSMVPVPGHLAM